MALLLPRRRGVGVIEMFGVIGNPARLSVLSRLLESVRADRLIGAVVLDIDSPGGTVSGSELLYTHLSRIAERKPVVAFIRGTGASGAFYLSCAATRVVALPTALVGSIGVIYLRPVIQELLSKLGMGFSVYKGGHMKDMGGFWRTPTPEEEAKFQGLIEELYGIFVGVVARGRNMEEVRVRELATGEIFTGRRAQELGLVDEVGDFERALSLAAELGNVRRSPKWIRPKRSFFERLTGRMVGSAPESILRGLEGFLTGGIFYLPSDYLPGGLIE